MITKLSQSHSSIHSAAPVAATSTKQRARAGNKCATKRSASYYKLRAQGMPAGDDDDALHNMAAPQLDNKERRNIYMHASALIAHRSVCVHLRAYYMWRLWRGDTRAPHVGHVVVARAVQGLGEELERRVILRGEEAAQPHVAPQLRGVVAHLRESLVELQRDLGLIRIEVLARDACDGLHVGRVQEESLPVVSHPYPSVD